MIRAAVRAIAILVVVLVGHVARADGDAARGGRLYRACVSCHSLAPGSHLNSLSLANPSLADPSLADLWERPAGKAEAFARYSAGLKAADFHWDTAVLDAWLADPRAMIPDTRMVFRGIAEAQERADIVAFLAVAMAPNGADAVVERGFAPPGYACGQEPEPEPEPLTPTPPGARVTRIRHCGDSYFVTATDGAETAHWEISVRIKLDARDTGPAAGAPVIVAAGMMGDRVSIVFASLRDLNSLLEEAC